MLSQLEISGIVLEDGELAGFAFVAPGAVPERVTPFLARRIAACLEAMKTGTVAALENGSPAA